MFNHKVQTYINYIADSPILINLKGNKISLKSENFIRMIFNSNYFSKMLDELNFGNILSKYDIGGTVLNIGANIGLYALFVASSVEKVYAVESTKEFTDIMKDFIEINNIDNVEITDYHNQAVDLAIIDTNEVSETVLENILASDIKTFVLEQMILIL